jgi:transcription elongation factor Elf1
MSAKTSFECAYCAAKDTFVDVKDALTSRWKVIAYSVDKGREVIICNKCNESLEKRIRDL